MAANILAGQDDLLNFKLSIRMGIKVNLCDFESGMIAGSRRAGLSNFRKLLIY